MFYLFEISVTVRLLFVSIKYFSSQCQLYKILVSCNTDQKELKELIKKLAHYFCWLELY